MKRIFGLGEVSAFFRMEQEKAKKMMKNVKNKAVDFIAGKFMFASKNREFERKD